MLMTDVEMVALLKKLGYKVIKTPYDNLDYRFRDLVVCKPLKIFGHAVGYWAVAVAKPSHHVLQVWALTEADFKSAKELAKTLEKETVDGSPLKVYLGETELYSSLLWPVHFRVS